MLRPLLVFLTVLVAPVSVAEERQLYWGDTHVHTNNSFDAFARLNRSADPETAYRYASGKPVLHPYHEARIRIETPLDFLVIADHAEYLGVFKTINQSGIPEDGLADNEIDRKNEVEAWLKKQIDNNNFFEFVSKISATDPVPESAARNSFVDTDIVPNYDLITSRVWSDYADTADQWYEPGRFTTLIGWEWSSIPGGANLHRVVFTDADAAIAKTFSPFHLGDSPYPEDLWAWLDKVSEQTQAEFVAIPHNSNVSKGYMFPEVTIKGEPVTTSYARSRLKWEPVVEVTQMKGDSETIPLLSPGDEFADFETYTWFIQHKVEAYEPDEGDYVRSGLKRGLEMEQRLGVNPYKFGMIGSTDTHTGMASAEEQNFHGKMATDSIPELKTLNPIAPERTSGWSMAAQGLAAVWADRNDRESIMAAFKRREVYSTSGPRIQLRFFGGWDFRKRDLRRADFAEAGYRKGVPMGGDLVANERAAAPSFMIHAARDPKSANLDRAQVVKAWLDAEGLSREKVFDVAWSGDRKPGADGKLPAVGNTVNLENASYENSIGSEELATVWVDPEFDPTLRALYYVRVLEIPTPRHSLADALALGMEKPDRGPSFIQERAYSSPIWYTP